MTGLCEVKRFAVSFYCLCLSFKHFLLPGPYITLLYALLSFKSLLSNLALSLPVISFFEGDDAKMLFFFSLSKAPLGLFLFHVKKIYICDALYQRACKYCKPIPGFAFMCLGFVGWMSGMRSVSFHLVVTGRMNAFKKTKTTLHKKPFTEVLNFL